MREKELQFGKTNMLIGNDDAYIHIHTYIHTYTNIKRRIYTYYRLLGGTFEREGAAIRED